MNVRCESCDTVYRIDPDRLPVRGVRARCTVCSHVIAIEGQTFARVPGGSSDGGYAPHTQDRVANALGDAFIPPPKEAVVQDATPAFEPVLEPEIEEPDASALERSIASTGDLEAPAETAEAEPEPPYSYSTAEPSFDLVPDERIPPTAAIQDSPLATFEPETPAPPQEPGATEALEPMAPAARIDSVRETDRPATSRPDTGGTLDSLETLDRDVPPTLPPWEAATVESPPAPIPETSPKAKPTPSVQQAAEEGASTRGPAPFAGGAPNRTAEPARPTERGQRPRLSRPFSVPRGLVHRPAAPPPKPPEREAPAPEPARPSAPVFTPSAGRPVQPPPVPTPTPDRSPAPAALVPPKPPEPAPQAPVASEPAGRPVNPFLSRDPRQKARRLARALISDMIVYQPEKRQRAIRDGNLKEAFDEEIKKSWQEFVEQVGQEIAESTTHFNDALNDILAGGQKIF